MSCRLKNEVIPKTIPMKDLPGGKLAVITQGEDAGRIVQRCTVEQFGFVILGNASKGGETSNGYDSACSLQVCVLEEGELIEVHYS